MKLEDGKWKYEKKDILHIALLTPVVAFAPVALMILIFGTHTSYCDGLDNCIDAWVRCFAVMGFFGIIFWKIFKRLK